MKKQNSEKYKVIKKASDKKSVKYYLTLKKAEQVAIEVLDMVENLKELSGKKIREKTLEFKKRLSNGETLDDILVEAFSVAYKAIQEVYGISLYKVQIMGGFGLHSGDVSEMKTGEGKTLTAILPAYLNALQGEGVHVITVNEYLASRDSYNTGKVFSLLGLKTSFVNSQMDPDQKREAYNSDITYLVHSELGFDYLRDNLVSEIQQKMQRKMNFAIVDEVDSILIDEARTPLIISGGKSFEDSDYEKARDLVLKLSDEDYQNDMETKRTFLTDSGIKKAQEFYGFDNLYSFENSLTVHLISNALQARHMFEKDVDYTIKDDEIVLIDSFTGRLLDGRRLSEGLHQAIEAKEEVEINPETKVFASITYQNLFRMYKKLSGMSGTALSEEEEFLDIYNMRVLSIPTNLPIKRIDYVDVVFASRKAKYKSLVRRIQEIHETGQPILIGTRSVQESELISNMISEFNIKHEVLNAKNHAREADIIENAGLLNQVTISTNMAGRGTDIKLGKGVIEKGGLFVLGTERNEARRIDDQLRGRAGRQGDIGASQFYVSLEDEIMQRAGLGRVKKFLKSMDEDPISSRSVQKAITVAQKKLEGTNYDYRKGVVEYDDVLNTQRIITYKQRDMILKLHETKEAVEKMVINFVSGYYNDKYFEKLMKSHAEDYFQLFIKEDFLEKFNIEIKHELDELSIEEIREKMIYIIMYNLEIKAQEFIKASKDFNVFVKGNLLMSLDNAWQDQINRLNKLKVVIKYRQYSQKNPVQVYIHEADKAFEFYKNQISENFIKSILDFSLENAMMGISQENSRKTKELIME